MTRKKLESFKIGDTKRPTVSGPRRPTGDGPKSPSEVESQSVGFGRIEKILDKDDAQAVSDSLSKLIQNLEDFERQAKNNKDKASAKKAIIAVERTADLLDFLFQTKAQLQVTTRQ